MRGTILHAPGDIRYDRRVGGGARVGMPDEVGAVGALLMGPDAASSPAAIS